MLVAAASMIAEAETAFQEGIRLKQAGDIPAAITCFRRAAELDESDPRYWVSLGVALSELHQWSEAVKVLTIGVGLKPHYAEADARLFLAEALKASGDAELARKQLEIIASMEPSYPSYALPIDEAKRQLAL